MRKLEKKPEEGENKFENEQRVLRLILVKWYQTFKRRPVLKK